MLLTIPSKIQLSLMAPQHPKNETMNIKAPVAINILGSEKYLVSKKSAYSV